MNHVRIDTLPLSQVSLLWEEDFNFNWSASFGANPGQCFQVKVTSWADGAGSKGLTFKQKVCAPTAVPVPTRRMIRPLDGANLKLF